MHRFCAFRVAAASAGFSESPEKLATAAIDARPMTIPTSLFDAPRVAA